MRILKFNESIVNIKSIEFEISDDEIKVGDFFIDIKPDGTVEPFIHELLDEYDDAKDYTLKSGIDVIVLDKGDYEWNSKMSDYKKIISDI